MVQSADKRLVTEQALIDAINNDIPTKVNRMKTRLLDDQFNGLKPGKVPSTKAVVSLTTNDLDGYVAGGPLLHPGPALSVVEANWSADTLQPYGTAFVNLSKANGVGNVFDFTTMFDGTHMVVSSYKIPSGPMDIRLWIDDVEVSDWYRGTRATGVLQTDKPFMNALPADDGQSMFLNINFAKRGIYKVRVSGIGVSGVASILSTNPGMTFQKPKKQRVVGIISDSWYDYIVASGTSIHPGVELSARTGWKVWNMANGGSGFVNPAGGATPINYGSDAVFASLAKAPPLDLLIVNGSCNDMGYTEASVISAMQAFFTRFKSVRPDTPIIWQGIEPQSYFENIYTSAAMVARENALAAVALAEPNVIGVIKCANENWLTGTGNTGAPNGTGNQDFVTGGDGVHLSAYGTQFIGSLVAERIGSMATWKGGLAV